MGIASSLRDASTEAAKIFVQTLPEERDWKCWFFACTREGRRNWNAFFRFGYVRMSNNRNDLEKFFVTKTKYICSSFFGETNSRHFDEWRTFDIRKRLSRNKPPTSILRCWIAVALSRRGSFWPLQLYVVPMYEPSFMGLWVRFIY